MSNIESPGEAPGRGRPATKAPKGPKSSKHKKIRYVPMEGVEGMEDIQLYNEGGYHPIHIGEILHRRWKVVHKLGHGGFATVWLCWEIKTPKWKAVKVMTADHSADENDLTMIKFMTGGQSQQTMLAQSHLDVDISGFWLDGPNGRHLCFMSDVHGCAVTTWSSTQDSTKQSTAAAITSVCHQVAKSVRFLHDRGICHGDLKPANILMRLQGIEKLSKAELLRLTGKPQQVNTQTVSGKSPKGHAPEYLVEKLPSEWCQDLVTPSVAIIDFGHAFRVGFPSKTATTATPYAAPEVMLEDAPGSASDIWSLACTIYEIKTNRTLFESSKGEGVRDTLDEITRYLGPLPEAYRTSEQTNHVSSTQAIASRETFEETLGSERQILRSVPNYERLPPNEQFQTITYRYPQEEVPKLADLLKSMLKYNPAERTSSEQVCNHPWFGVYNKHSMYNKLPRLMANILFWLLVIVALAMVWPGTKPAIYSAARSMYHVFQPQGESCPKVVTLNIVAPSQGPFDYSQVLQLGGSSI
ncbi:Uu.00g047270.m01.CDS01 [Anthostomella pinea]|uniref:non-specific serine/threonine protein kinase n=1 Tax=Anthostomella pinea TaxID=933095 RepID=A0AAI8VBH9_9PEZI|nr:Uu.00g047270.m01.CDS01 [Anthostomella pinea]